MHFCFLLPIIWQVFHFTTQILLFDIHQTLFLETFKTPPLDFKYKFWICLHLDKRNVLWFMLYLKLQLSSVRGQKHNLWFISWERRVGMSLIQGTCTILSVNQWMEKLWPHKINLLMASWIFAWKLIITFQDHEVSQFFHLHWFLSVWFNGNWPFSHHFFDFFFSFSSGWICMHCPNNSFHWLKNLIYTLKKLKSKIPCHSLTQCKMAFCHEVFKYVY